MENTKNYTEEIISTLKYVGIPASLKGYEYLKVSLQLVLESPSLIYQITKGLYPAVAERCGTIPSRVERAIRHTVEITFDRLHPEVLKEVFGNCTNYYKGKVTNSEFIAILAEKIRMDLGEYK